MVALQPVHIIIILLVGVLFFAPSRMPLLGRGVTKMISEFRREIGSNGKKTADDVHGQNPPSKS